MHEVRVIADRSTILRKGSSRKQKRAASMPKIAKQKSGDANNDGDSPVTYDIFTYPADFTLEGLVTKLKKKDVIIPDFQRQFVWTKAQSSKLIESFLLGLPVPPIYLYQDRSNKLLVVDGQQRLKTIAYFFEGYFGETVAGRRPVFRLSGLNPESEFADQTYEDLRESNEPAFSKLNDAVLRSFVIKQMDPKDDTSVFYIFERLNSGGALIRGQEIRNAIFNGPFNDLIKELNTLTAWRALIGRKQMDKRQRDVERVLRFFALTYSIRSYEKPMKEFLNKFMASVRHSSEKQIDEYKKVFRDTLAAITKSLGERPFHIRSGLNTAVLDDVFPAFAMHLKSIPRNIRKRYKDLLKDKIYIDLTTYRTSDTDVVKKRRALVEKKLFDQ